MYLHSYRTATSSVLTAEAANYQSGLVATNIHSGHMYVLASSASAAATRSMDSRYSAALGVCLSLGKQGFFSKALKEDPDFAQSFLLQ